MAEQPSARATSGLTESFAVRATLIGVALAFILAFLVLPLMAVFTEAFRKGLGAYVEAIADPVALAAVKLTFIAAAISVPLNLVFGVAASWAIAKFEFRGRGYPDAWFRDGLSAWLKVAMEMTGARGVRVEYSASVSAVEPNLHHYEVFWQP